MGAGGDVDGGARQPTRGNDATRLDEDAPDAAANPVVEAAPPDASLIGMTRQFAHYATVGIMFPVSIGLGFFFGYLIDQWLGTIPLFALVGLGLGIAAAIRNLLRVVASDKNV